MNSLSDAFERLRLSSPDWPVFVHAALAGEKAARRWPRFPKAATVEFGRVGHGRGLSEDESRLRALGEAVEIASCCQWGGEQITVASAAELGEDAWRPAALNGFSPEQMAGRDAWNVNLAGLDWVPRTLPDGEQVEWMAARSLVTDRVVWLPADFVLLGRGERGTQTACSVADTNGCAAGPTFDAACLSALYELVERDATGRWWYGGRGRRRLDPTSVEHGETMVRHCAGRGRRLALFDITSDIAIPTVAAISSGHEGRRIAVGFATRARLHEAALSALCELMQIELRIEAAVADREIAGGIEDWLDAMKLPDVAPFALEDGTMTSIETETRAVADDLSACAGRMAAAGCDVAVVDLTRRQFGVPVARAASPQLCHWKPRFGKARLLAGDDRDLSRLHVAAPNPALLRI